MTEEQIENTVIRNVDKLGYASAQIGVEHNNGTDLVYGIAPKL